MIRKLIILFTFCLASLSVRAVTLDVLVLYDTQMNNHYSGAPQVKINQAIAWANVAFVNSGSDIQLNLIAAQLFNLSAQSSVSEAALEGLLSNAQAMNIRNNFKPDVTIYFTKGSSTHCGIAYLPRDGHDRAPTYAVGVVAYDCMNYVLAHEVGHILGAGHGIRDTSGGNGTPIASSRGYGVDSLFVDVMAYESLYGYPTKVQNFSSPNLNCFGLSCGTANDNAAGGIKQYAPKVAKYSGCYPAVYVKWGYWICR